MIDISKGRYWDKPWSLIDGCTPCSPGCENCWSAAMEVRFKKNKRLAPITDEKGNFAGVIHCRPDRLNIPLKTRQPTVWAIWNDLFHEDVLDEFILQAVRTMGGAFWHTYLILTKRPHRAKAVIDKINPFLRRDGRSPFGPVWEHVWLGVTVCNQQEADKKIQLLLETPAAHRWVSIEPMLGPIEFRSYTLTERACFVCKDEDFLHQKRGSMSHPINCGWRHDEGFGGSGIDAVICGGETGPHARPMHPDWVRSVRDQCAAAGVNFFLKSGLGKKRRYYQEEMALWGNYETVREYCEDGNGWDPYIQMNRLLDGCTHDDLPWRMNNAG